MSSTRRHLPDPATIYAAVAGDIVSRIQVDLFWMGLEKDLRRNIRCLNATMVFDIMVALAVPSHLVLVWILLALAITGSMRGKYVERLHEVRRTAPHWNCSS